MEDIDYVCYHFYVFGLGRDFLFLLRTLAIGKEFTTFPLGWAIGSTAQLSLPSPMEFFLIFFSLFFRLLSISEGDSASHL